MTGESMRATVVFTCLLAWASAPASAGAPPQRTSASPLRTASKVRFSESHSLAWLQPAQCDANGNVVLVTEPAPDPRDLKALPAMPRHTKNPSDVTIISADGKKTTVLTSSCSTASGRTRERARS
jgi:hypothetical protein